MKKLVITALTIVTLATATPAAPAQAQSVGKAFAKEYAATIYGSAYKVKVVKEENLTNKMLRQRMRKHIVYVSIVKSKSLDGKYGRTSKGCTIRYNKKVKKGKTVKSFLVYNPESTGYDDIVAVIDNKKIRVIGELS